MTIDERIEKVRALHNEVNANVFGVAFHDADTILVDLQEEGLDIDATGVANEIFDIYKKTSDKKAFLDLFESLVGTSFTSYLRKCETGIKAIKNGNSDDTTELVGQIMDQVENFMEKREGTEEPILVGDNYDKLSRSVTETLQNWGLLPKEGVQV